MNILLKSASIVMLAGTIVYMNAAKIEITPTVGKLISQHDSTLDDSKVLFGIRGTAFVNDNVGVQAVVESSQNNPTVGGGDTDIERGSLNAVYEKATGLVRPYGLVGVGYERTHGATVQTTNDDSQMFYNVGAGLKFDINKHVDITTEVKAIHKVENDDDDVIGTVGVGVKFGENKQKTPICATPKAMSLHDFSKMCKTQPVTRPVVVTQPQMVATQREVQPQMVTTQEAQPQPVTCEVEVARDEVVPGSEIPEGYYVQMAALFKGNGALLTGKLERKNYPYTLYNTKRFKKDVNLVLVGPYQSAKEAHIALRYLKRLSRKAFVKKFP